MAETSQTVAGTVQAMTSEAVATRLFQPLIPYEISHGGNRYLGNYEDDQSLFECHSVHLDSIRESGKGQRQKEPWGPAGRC